MNNQIEIRPNDWINVNTLTEIFSLQIKHNGKWCHVHSNGEPLFFDTAQERDEKIAELKAKYQK